VFEEELRSIAECLQVSAEALRQRTLAGKTVPYAFQPTRLGFTRWLPLPCPCYSVEQNGCQAYAARAVVCRIYPIVFTGDDSYMSIRVTCDYGKDVLVGALQRLRASDPQLEMKL
jgi:Fe-S-cluster containining protein